MAEIKVNRNDKRNKKLQGFVTDILKQSRVLVVGDVMLDKYYFGEVKRISYGLWSWRRNCH